MLDNLIVKIDNNNLRLWVWIDQLYALPKLTSLKDNLPP